MFYQILSGWHSIGHTVKQLDKPMEGKLRMAVGNLSLTATNFLPWRSAWDLQTSTVVSKIATRVMASWVTDLKEKNLKAKVWLCMKKRSRKRPMEVLESQPAVIIRSVRREEHWYTEQPGHTTALSILRKKKVLLSILVVLWSCNIWINCSTYSKYILNSDVKILPRRLQITAVDLWSVKENPWRNLISTKGVADRTGKASPSKTCSCLRKEGNRLWKCHCNTSVQAGTILQINRFIQHPNGKNTFKAPRCMAPVVWW